MYISFWVWWNSIQVPSFIYLPETRCTWKQVFKHGTMESVGIHLCLTITTQFIYSNGLLPQWKKMLETTKFNIWPENNILSFKLHIWSPVHHKYLKIRIIIPHKSTLHRTWSVFYHYSIISFSIWNLWSGCQVPIFIFLDFDRTRNHTRELPRSKWSIFYRLILIFESKHYST